MLNLLNEEETLDVLEECREVAGADIAKIMELVIPKIYEIQGLVMQKFGFQPTDDGFEQFAASLKQNEGEFYN